MQKKEERLKTKSKMGKIGKGKAMQARNGGITLIALVVTIVVLLILAGVSISMLTGDNGLLTITAKAKERTEDGEVEEKVLLAYNSAVSKEYAGEDTNIKTEMQEELEKEYETVKVKSKGGIYTVTIDGKDYTVGEEKWDYYDSDDDGLYDSIAKGDTVIAIGSYVDYNEQVDENDETKYTSLTSKKEDNGYADQVFNLSSYTYGWRVLGAEDGKILLISDELIGPDEMGGSATTKNPAGRTYFYLKGQAGYVNAESELTKIAQLYGQGKYASSARTVKVEDINILTGYNPNVIKYGAGEVDEYGNKVTYYWDGTKYPYYKASDTLKGNLTRNDHSSNGFNWYDLSTKTWKKSEYTTSASTSAMEEITTLTATFYYYYPQFLTRSSTDTTGIMSTDSDIYKMLFTNSEKGSYPAGAGSTAGIQYWFGEPCVRLYDARPADFCVRSVYYYGVYANDLYDSAGNSNSYPLRCSCHSFFRV